MGKAIIVGMARKATGRAFGLLGSDAADGITARDTLRDALRHDARLVEAGEATADAASANVGALRANDPMALARIMVDKLSDSGFDPSGIAANKAGLDFMVCETLISRALAADGLLDRRSANGLPVPPHFAHGWREGRIAQTMVDILTADGTWKDEVARLRDVITATAPEPVADAVIRRLGTLRQDRSDLSVTLKGGVASLSALETVAESRGGFSKTDAENARKAVSDVCKKARAEKRDADRAEFVAAIVEALDADHSPAAEKTPADVLKGLQARIRAAAKKMPNANAAARVAALEAFGNLLQLWGEDATTDPVLPHGAADRLTRMADDLLAGRQVTVDTADGSEPVEAPVETPVEAPVETPVEAPVEAPDTAIAAAMETAKAAKASKRRRGAANASA